MTDTTSAANAAAAGDQRPDAIAEVPAMLSNLMYANLMASTNLSQQNAVAHQQAGNELSVSVLGRCVNFIAREK